MNIFFIPSWYPSKSNPTAGNFIKEQALAIGKFHQDANIIISLWGDYGTKINFENPGQVLPHLANFFQDKSYVRQIAPRVYEFNQPALEWSARFFRGNIKAILKANALNFQKAQKKFGKIDLIHAHVSFPAGFLAMKLAEKYHLPYLITEHMGPFPLAPFQNNHKLISLVTKPLEKADQVIAVSSRLQSELLKYKIKSVVVPNLVDESYFTLAPQKQHQNFTFFSLGDISSEKGFEDLIKAAASALKKEKNIKFRIGGKGKSLKKYRKMANDLKIEENITWLGHLSQKQVLKELHQCNAFILPSHHESFGMVFLEALSCGRPVIATRCGGPEDFVREDNGLLVDTGNIKMMASAIIKIRRDIDRFKPEKIRAGIIKKYSSQAVSRELIKLYQDFV